MATYELQYLPMPDVTVFMPDGETVAIKFEDGIASTDDKEVYKHVKAALGPDLVRTNKPAKGDEAEAAPAATGDATPDTVPAPKKPKAEK